MKSILICFTDLYIDINLHLSHSFLQAFKERSPNTYCVLVSVFTDTVVNNTSNALRELIFFWNRQKITIKCYQCHEFSMEAYRIVTHVGISCVISDTSLD